MLIVDKRQRECLAVNNGCNLVWNLSTEETTMENVQTFICCVHLRLFVTVFLRGFNK
jgi:hypothetical protein